MRRLTFFFLSIAACDSAGSNQGSLDVEATPDGDGRGDATAPTDSSAPTDAVTAPGDSTATDGSAIDTTTPPDTANPSDTTADATPTDTGPSSAVIGAACQADGDCGAGGACLDLPGGYCSLGGCDTTACPTGSSCWGLGDLGNFCLKDCTATAECRGGDGYICDSDNTCWPESTTPTGDSPVGGPCEGDSDCKDPGAFCYPATVQGEATGFFLGYCMIGDCTATSCPTGSTCQPIFADGSSACVDSCGASDACGQGYGCFDPGMCFPSCEDSGCPTNFGCDAATDTCVPACTATSCPEGLVCKADGTCGAPPCTANSCGAGYLCAPSGDCVPDLQGGPGPGPGPACATLPPRDCTEGAAKCGEVIAFEPDLGPGYWDYPINGETVADQYRSYARRDLVMLIKWAAAAVECKATAWAGGNHQPIGLGDMSEANGDIPGTRDNDPGHPAGTHVDGFDMDIGYFQTAASPDNKLRPICPHTEGGQEAYHCTGAPTLLDVWRDALFLGLLLQSPRTRVIGVDGKVGPLVEQALDVLCGEGWLVGTPCSQNRALAYETTDQGMGWFLFHLHHQHVSLKPLAPAAPSLPGGKECLVPGCGAVPDGRMGHGYETRLEVPLRQLVKTRLPR